MMIFKKRSVFILIKMQFILIGWQIISLCTKAKKKTHSPITVSLFLFVCKDKLKPTLSIEEMQKIAMLCQIQSQQSDSLCGHSSTQQSENEWKHAFKPLFLLNIQINIHIQFFILAYSSAFSNMFISMQYIKHKKFQDGF